ncbi:MAG: SPOR domain-containing protein [Mariprofundus sp.]|nr:SPOR domain-containing protein [Mariprofundus sp.]
MENSFESTWDTGRFTEETHEKKEPSIPGNPVLATEFDPSEEIEKPAPVRAKEQLTADKETEKQISAPQISPLQDDRSTPSSATPDTGIKPITIFAIGAMLIAAIAVWFNPGAENNNNASVQHETPTILNPDIQMQRMERRISSLEQQVSQESVGLKDQIDNLEKQLSSLNRLVAKQSGASRSGKHVVKSKPSKPKASITPVAAKSYTGWVVNLMSLDSLSAAKKALSNFKAKGITAEIGRYSAKGKTRYRIRVAGFASKQEADTQKEYLTRKHHIKAAWVNKP